MWHRIRGVPEETEYVDAKCITQGLVTHGRVYFKSNRNLLGSLKQRKYWGEGRKNNRDRKKNSRFSKCFTFVEYSCYSTEVNPRGRVAIRNKK